MGRSGIAIAKAAKARGATPVVLDEAPAESEERIALQDELQAQGIEVVCGWHGRLEPGDHDILVASPGFRRTHPAILDAQALGMEVISEIEFAGRIARGPIVAITGTNGKSTTTVMTWLILQGLGHDPILCGNISGSGYDELTLTEAADQGQDEQPLVAEISSFQLEWVRTFRPRAAAITNITPDHLDRHPTFEDYAQTKLRIFAQMGSGDTVVLPAEEPSLTSAQIRAALPPGCVLKLVGPGQDIRFAEGQLWVGNEAFPMESLPFSQTYQLTNATIALGLAQATSSNWDAERAVEGLRKFQPLRFRMEILGERDGIQVINNSMCTNPMAVVHSSSGCPRKQFLLLGGLTKNLDFHPVGTYLRTSGHVPVLFGPAPDALRTMLGIDAPAFPSLAEAFHHAVSSALAGDAVILAPGCASSFPYANFRERGEAFQEIAKEWLTGSSNVRDWEYQRLTYFRDPPPF